MSKELSNFGIGALLAVGAYMFYRKFSPAASLAATPARIITVAGVEVPAAATLPRANLSSSDVAMGPAPTLLPGGEYSCPAGYHATFDTSSGNVYCVPILPVNSLPIIETGFPGDF